MSGAPDDWTVGTLRELLQQQIDSLQSMMQQQMSDLRSMLDERYLTQTRAVEAAFLAQSTAMTTALTAAKQAVETALQAQEKASALQSSAAEKRFDSFRIESTTQITSIGEKWDSAHSALTARVNGLELRLSSRLDVNDGQDLGVQRSVMNSRSVTGQTIAITSVVVAIIVAIITIIIKYAPN